MTENPGLLTRDQLLELMREVGQLLPLWDAVAEVAVRRNLPPDWINTDATAFMTNDDVSAVEITLPGLRVALASPEHLIAMKLRAMRDRDLADLDTLFRMVGITKHQKAVEIHDRLLDESNIGYADPDEALYAARLVLDRAAACGNPIA